MPGGLRYRPALISFDFVRFRFIRPGAVGPGGPGRGERIHPRGSPAGRGGGRCPRRGVPHPRKGVPRPPGPGATLDSPGQPAPLTKSALPGARGGGARRGWSPPGGPRDEGVPLGPPTLLRPRRGPRSPGAGAAAEAARCPLAPASSRGARPGSASGGGIPGGVPGAATHPRPWQNAALRRGAP